MVIRYAHNIANILSAKDVTFAQLLLLPHQLLQVSANLVNRYVLGIVHTLGALVVMFAAKEVAKT